LSAVNLGAVKKRLDRQIYISFAFVVALLILPLFVGDDSYTMQLLIMAMIWAAVSQSWDLLLGYAGIFNLGQIGFFVCGAYASAMLSYYAGVSPWLGLIAGFVVGGIVAVLVGLPCLRLSGIYVALLTLAFFEVLGPLLTVGKAVGTGGKQGLFPLAPYTWGAAAFDYYSKVPWFYLCLGLFTFCLIVIYFVINSRFGSSFIALHDSESLARSLGIDRYKTSLIVVGISGALTGLMGAFYAHYTSVLSPRLLGLDLFLFLVIMILLGGVGKFPGAVIGAFVVTFLDDWLRPTGEYRLLILGALVVVIVLLAPRGLMGAFDSLGRVFRRRTGRRPDDVAGAAAGDPDGATGGPAAQASDSPLDRAVGGPADPGRGA
jgi:branched-chain amino acid transport system permease protein